MSTAKSALYGLDAPDEQTDLNLKDASQKEILEASYKAWLSATEEIRKSTEYPPDAVEPQYREACRIVRPFKEPFNGELEAGPETLPFLTENDEKTIGYFLSALLNETDLEKLSMEQFPDYFCPHGIGYRLRPGKTIEVLKDAYVWGLGEHARGGTIINYGKACIGIGTYASGGVFVNEGWAEEMGCLATGGTFLNKNEIKWTLGTRARGGTYLNIGIIHRNLGPGAHGGTFLNRGTVKHTIGGNSDGGVYVTRSWPCHFKRRSSEGNVYRAGPEMLEFDKPLSDLMHEVVKAGVLSDVPKVNRIARKIDEHVRKNYQPRGVA